MSNKGEDTVDHYDLFISYSTDPDFHLAQKVHEFLETFHRRRLAVRRELAPLRVCRDSISFVEKPEQLNEHSESVKPGTEAPNLLPQSVLKKLSCSRFLLLIGSLGASRSKYVQEEAQWFLANRPQYIILAASEGSSLSDCQDRLYPPSIVTSRLASHQFVIDLRAYSPRRNTNAKKIRDYREELGRLAAVLYGMPEVEHDYTRYLKRERRLKVALAGLAAIICIVASIFIRNAAEHLFEQKRVTQFSAEVDGVSDALTNMRRAHAASENDPGPLALDAARLYDSELAAKRKTPSDIRYPELKTSVAQASEKLDDVIFATQMFTTNLVADRESTWGEILPLPIGGATTRPDGTPDIASAPSTYISAIAISPDDKLLAVAGDDRSLTFRDSATGSSRNGIFCDARIEACEFSPTGDGLLAGCADHVVRLWDPESGMLKHQYQAGANILGVQFSPKGNLVAASLANGSCVIWDRASERPVASLIGGVVSFRLADESGRAVAVHADGSISRTDPDTSPTNIDAVQDGLASSTILDDGNGAIVVSMNGDVTLHKWNPAQLPKHIKNFNTFPVQPPVLSPDGRYCALLMGSGLQIINLQNLQDVRTLRIPYTRTPGFVVSGFGLGSGLAFSHDGQRLIVALHSLTERVRTYPTLAPAKILGPLRVKGDIFQFSDDDQFLISNSDDEQKLSILDIRHEAEGLGEIGEPGDEVTCASATDQTCIASGWKSGECRCDSLNPRRSLFRVLTSNKPIDCCSVSSSGGFVAACSDDGTIYAWTIHGQPLWKKRIGTRVTQCGFSSDGRWLVTVGQVDHATCRLFLWKAADGTPVAQYPTFEGVPSQCGFAKNDDCVFVVFTPNDNTTCTLVAWDRTTAVMRISTGVDIDDFGPPLSRFVDRELSTLTTLGWHMDQIGGGTCGIIESFDATTNSKHEKWVGQLYVPSEQPMPLRCARSNDGKLLASISGNRISVWRLDAGDSVFPSDASHGDPVIAITAMLNQDQQPKWAISGQAYSGAGSADRVPASTTSQPDEGEGPFFLSGDNTGQIQADLSIAMYEEAHGDFAHAESRRLHVADMESDLSNFVLLASDQSHLNKPNDAVNSLHEAVICNALPKDRAYAADLCGNILLQLARVNAARRCFLESGRLDPANYQHAVAHAETLAALGRYDLAMEEWQRITHDSPPAELAVNIPQWINQCQALSLLQKSAPFLPDDVITNVEPGSQAEAAGIAVGDLLIALNAKPENQLVDFVTAWKQLPAGSAATLTLLHNGQQEDVGVHTGHLGIATLPVLPAADLSLDSFYPAYDPQKIEMPATRPTMAPCAASKLMDWDELKVLINEGKDINSADERNRTALHWAAINANAEEISFLASHGANVNARDVTGRTALHYATDLHVVVALCAAGADVNVRSRSGETPLRTAQRYRRREIVDYLRAHGAVVMAASQPGG